MVLVEYVDNNTCYRAKRIILYLYHLSRFKGGSLLQR